MLGQLNLPGKIAVFDAGIGSYAVASLIHARAKSQDIIYLADRASFPYGSKTRQELARTLKRTVKYLESYGPDAIVLASNAPSIMVLEELREHASVPIHGVIPPLQKAIDASATKDVAILGVRSLIESAELAEFVKAHAGSSANVRVENASALVDLVESGEFIHNSKATQEAMDEFLRNDQEEHPSTDVYTLSSTHLPWLKHYFEKAMPHRQFLDPAEDTVARLNITQTDAVGGIRGLVTENEKYTVDEFRRLLKKLKISIPLTQVEF